MHRFFGGISIGVVLVAALAQTNRVAFDVASIKPDEGTQAPSIGPAPGGRRFVARNIPLLWLIGEAYSVPNSQILGLPAGQPPERYDIEAETDHPSSRAQMRQMLRLLLEERFKLGVRRQTKDMRANVLGLAPGGAKMKENQDGAEFSIHRITGSKTEYRNMPMSLFANILAGVVEGAVVDQTGLAGGYDFTLEYARDRVGQGVLDGREPAPDPNAPSIYTALRQQLGLKLESRKVTVQVLIVEHVERPSPN